MTNKNVIFTEILNKLDGEIRLYGAGNRNKYEINTQIMQWIERIIAQFPDYTKSNTHKNHVITRFIGTLMDIRWFLTSNRKTKRLINEQIQNWYYLRGLISGAGLDI